MSDRVENTVMIENAQLIFRNFTGQEKQYNRAGDRNFAVILEDSHAAELADMGWNIKQMKGRDDEEDTPRPYYIEVSVSDKFRPPNIVLIGSGGRTRLDVEGSSVLDYAEIENADLIFRPYNWEAGGSTGVKAYLQSLYVTIHEDELEKKYAQYDQEND